MAERGVAYHLYVGVDIAADTFTAAWLPAGGTPTMPLTCDQSPAGFADLQRRLRAAGAAPATTLHPEGTWLEATGTYWVGLAVALHDAGYHVSVVNPVLATARIRSWLVLAVYSIWYECLAIRARDYQNLRADRRDGQRKPSPRK